MGTNLISFQLTICWCYIQAQVLSEPLFLSGLRIQHQEGSDNSCKNSFLILHVPQDDKTLLHGDSNRLYASDTDASIPERTPSATHRRATVASSYGFPDVPAGAQTERTPRSIGRTLYGRTPLSEDLAMGASRSIAETGERAAVESLPDERGR